MPRPDIDALKQAIVQLRKTNLLSNPIDWLVDADAVIARVPELLTYIDELTEELRITYQLLENSNRVLNAVPECPEHGSGCIPHSVEWVEHAKRILNDNPAVVMMPAVMTNSAGRTVLVGKTTGEDCDRRNDLTVFVPHEPLDSSDWVCTVEGSPDEPARAFAFRSVQELRDTIPALNRALWIIYENAKAQAADKTD